MSEKLLIILGFTALGVGGTILLFFLYRSCIRKAALSRRRFVSVLHLILFALPLILFFLQDLKILPIAWPDFFFWVIGVACTLLPLWRNVRLWGLGYGIAFTLCEIFSSIALTMLIAAATYGIVYIAVFVLTAVVAFISSTHVSSQLIRVSDSPFGTDFFYVTPVNYGGFVDGEGNHYTSISGKRLLSTDGDIYYIVD